MPTIAEVVTDADSAGDANVHQNTLSGNIASGDDIIVCVAQSNTENLSSGSVTDSKGHTYTLHQESTVSGAMRIGMWSARASAAMTSGVDWIKFKVQFTNTAHALMYGMRITGMDTAPDFDKLANTTGTSANPSTGTTAATSQANEVAVAMHGYASNPSYTPDAGYSQTATTQLLYSTVLGLSVSYKILSATGTQAAVGTLGSSQNWGGVIVTFKTATVVSSDILLPRTPAFGTLGGGVCRS